MISHPLSRALQPGRDGKRDQILVGGSHLRLVAEQSREGAWRQTQLDLGVANHDTRDKAGHYRAHLRHAEVGPACGEVAVACQRAQLGEGRGFPFWCVMVQRRSRATTAPW